MMENINRYRYRCCHLKFIPFHLLSQLDLTRFWDRVLRRAEIPIGFSQGFNPRPLLSFGPATPTGVVSSSEYFDMILMESFDSEQLKKKLNTQIPKEMSVIDIEPISLNAPSIMKSLTGIQYDYFLKGVVEPADHLKTLLIEDIEVLKREKQGNQGFMISFLFKGKNLLLNPYKFLDNFPGDCGWSRENLIEVRKHSYRWSF